MASAWQGRKTASLLSLLRVLFVVAATSSGAEASKGKNFTTLPKTIIVKAYLTVGDGNGTRLNITLSPNATFPNGRPNPVPTPAVATRDKIHVTWNLNASFAGQDAAYKKVLFKLCYAPPSRLLRKWRKPNPGNLAKDKMCQFGIGAQTYTPAGGSFEYKIEAKIPGALYFIRAYAVDSLLNIPHGAVAWGSNTIAPNQTVNLIRVNPVSGRSVGLYIAVGVSSFLSVALLAGYFVREQIIAKNK